MSKPDDELSTRLMLAAAEFELVQIRKGRPYKWTFEDVEIIIERDIKLTIEQIEDNYIDLVTRG